MSDAADAAAQPVVSPEVSAIERSLNEYAHFASRARQHERLMAITALPLDRSAAATLRQLADAEPARIGELATRLAVEASHVTRQVQALEKTGYVARTADPEDGRAQLVRLTGLGRDAVERIRTVSRHGMQQVLENWPTEDVERLAVLIRRMVDDFIAHAEDESRYRFPE